MSKREYARTVQIAMLASSVLAGASTLPVYASLPPQSAQKQPSKIAQTAPAADNTGSSNADKSSTNTPGASTLGPDTPPALREYLQPLGSENNLNPILEESEQTFGASFIQPEEVVVKQPMLKALIQLNSNLSPYEIDARSGHATQLSDVLKTALTNNLAIKYTQADMEKRKWGYYGALGQFLPSTQTGYTYETLAGKFTSPFGVTTRLSTGNIQIPHILNLTLFKGGALIYGAKQAKHHLKAAQFAVQRSTNDILLEATERYYDLVLADVLLQIRIKAVEVSAALLARNEDRFANGAATKLDVLQSKSQLSRDRQALIQQQVARRKASVALATILNLDPGEDLVVGNRSISKIRLVDGQVTVGNLLQIAIDNRPELKRYEQLRLAAKDAVKVAFSQLLPEVQGFVGGLTTGARSTSSSASGSSSASSSTISAGTLASGVASASGGGGGGSGPRRFTPAEAYQLGLTVTWNLGGLGTVAATQVQSARWEARKAQIDFSRELAQVYKEVRDAYLEVISTENLIAETTDTVNSTREQLTVANIRLEEGVGTDIDTINAQRDYTQALIDKASAIVNFNVAEAKLLRAVGRVSYDSLTTLKPMVR